MTPYEFPLLIKQLLETAISQRSRKEIVYGDNVRYDYPTLVKRIKRLASGLAGLGVQKGDTVAVLDWDTNRYLEAYFGIPVLGATMMTTNIRLSPEQIAYTLDHSGAETLLVHTDFIPLIQDILPSLPKVKRLVCLSDDGTSPAGLDWTSEYEALLISGDETFEFPEFDEQTRATTFYTTGTTGMPKGVYFSHRQIVLHTLVVLSTIAQAGENAQFSRNDVYMPLTPMFHAHAWGYPYIATLSGWKQVYAGKFEPSFATKLALSEGVTFSHCVPTILDMVLNAPEAEGVDFKGWKFLIGGSGLPRGIAQRALARNIDVYCGYGMSESCPLLTVAQLKTDVLQNAVNPEDVALEKRLTPGMPILLAQVRVVNDAMESVPVDGASVGEVVVRTPYLTQGYHNNPEASRELWQGGWMHTGDIGRFDDEGYLHLVDRKKDVIKSGGEWISSIQLEDLISVCPGVKEVAVISVDDAKWGERPLVIVVEADPGTLLAETVREHLKTFVNNGLISPFAVPERFEFVETIARTSVGKIDKKALRKQYA